MKYLLLLFFFGLSGLFYSSTYAQETQSNLVYNNHYFEPGTKVRYQPVADSLIVYEDGGEGKIWDYSQLEASGEAYDRSIVASEETPFAAEFPEANVAIEGEQKDYVYMYSNSYTTEFIAYAPPDSSYLVHNYKPWPTAVHPMQLGDSLRTTAQRRIIIGDRVVYREGEVQTMVIGRGVLLLPEGRRYENVLLLKEVQIFQNPGRTNYYRATTYHWISNHSNFPLLSVNDIYEKNSKGDESNTRGGYLLLKEVGTKENKSIQQILENKQGK